MGISFPKTTEALHEVYAQLGGFGSGHFTHAQFDEAAAKTVRQIKPPADSSDEKGDVP